MYVKFCLLTIVYLLGPKSTCMAMQAYHTIVLQHI